MVWFLILSLLSGVLELGSVWYIWQKNSTVTIVLLFALLYQLGNLLHQISSLPTITRFGIRRQITVLGIGGIILLGINVFLTNLTLFGIEIVIASFCIQGSRSGCKEQCPAWLKRTFRIMGFSLSPLFAYSPQLGIALCLLIAVLAAFLSEPAISPQRSSVQELFRVSSVMVFHQLHYFVYTYIMPISIITITESTIAGSLSFALTWIVYLLPQTLAEYYNSIPYRQLFFLGHCFLALIMGNLSIAMAKGNIAAILIFWMATGLGGGTVFCIKHLTYEYTQINMTFSENLGHVLGPIIGILAINIFPGYEAVVLTACSCIFVCLTVFSALLTINKGRKFDDER